ncbi:MAG: hypothetical protein ACRD0W_25505, partial [Acidimicrobiales bacterium]
ARTISPDGATVAVLVIPTNEELEIAQQALHAATRPHRNDSSIQLRTTRHRRVSRNGELR